MSRSSGSAGHEAEPGRKSLWLGILAYRWATLAWMTSLAAFAGDELRNPVLAWISIAVTVVWCAWFSLIKGWERPSLRWVDLGVSAFLLLISGLVMAEGSVVGDGPPFFATAYPVTAAMTMAAATGLRGGLIAGTALSICLVLSRPLNGVPISELELDQVVDTGNGVAYYLAASGTVGLVSKMLTRSESELRAANEEAMRQRERVARLAERESLGREIHDSVLQALGLVNKRGKELAASPSVSVADVRSLAEMAAEQEQALRALLQAEPTESPAGKVSLRTVLEASAFGISGLPVTIACVGTIWLAANQVDELSAAVRQALGNAARHSHGTKVTVFADSDGGETVVSVRDDGTGFEYDEDRLRDEGKLGVLKSMKGRIEELGGTMRIHTAPGKGTEVEFRLSSESAVGV
jgi:signal transduction histidine kinase